MSRALLVESSAQFASLGYRAVWEFCTLLAALIVRDHTQALWQGGLVLPLVLPLPVVNSLCTHPKDGSDRSGELGGPVLRPIGRPD